MDNYHVPQITTDHSQQHPTCQANKRLCQLISQAYQKKREGSSDRVEGDFLSNRKQKLCRLFLNLRHLRFDIGPLQTGIGIIDVVGNGDARGLEEGRW